MSYIRKPWSLLLAITGLGLGGNDQLSSAARSDDAKPLRGSIHLRIDDPANPGRRNLRLDQPGALPLKAGDRFRIEVKLNRPAYVYLFWLGSDGKVAPIHPWAPGHWDRRPRGGSQEGPARPAAEGGAKPWRSRWAARASRRLSCWPARRAPCGETSICPSWQSACRFSRGRPSTRRSGSRMAERSRLDQQGRAPQAPRPARAMILCSGSAAMLREKVQSLSGYTQAVLFPNQGGP